LTPAEDAYLLALLDPSYNLSRITVKRRQANRYHWREWIGGGPGD
jgi:hypothetical protein